ncbi:MAG: TIGR01777 family oxidoreductase [bacterium]
MKILITGGTGLIGQKLTEKLEERGDEVLIVSRSRSGEQYINWDPENQGSLTIPEGTDAVVHLAGAPVFGERWSDDYKQEIRDSRVKGTRTVVNAIEEYDGELECFVSGSATGYYGDRDNTKLSEEDDPGDDFLAGVCKEWEAEAKKLDDDSTPVSIIRTGIVLSMEDGALRRMLNPVPYVWPFHLGLGGPLGLGKQYMPWIHIEDEVRAIMYLIDEGLEGIYNLSAPEPVSNWDYTQALGSALNRPAFFPLPYFVLRILFGKAASILWSSQRVYPNALEEEGFEFKYTDVQSALEDLV